MLDNARARTRPDARALFFSSSFNQPSSSPSEELDSERAGLPPHAEGGEGQFWIQFVERLAAHGLNDARTAAASARAAGWTREQVQTLLRQFEADAIAVAACDTPSQRVLRWRPGVLWWQLTRGVPGSEITVPPQEAWHAAQAEAESKRQRQEHAAGEIQASAEKARRAQQHELERQRLEAEFGEILDAIPRAQVLAWESLQASRAWLARRWTEGGPMPAGVVRTIALRTLRENLQEQEQAR